MDPCHPSHQGRPIPQRSCARPASSATPPVPRHIPSRFAMNTQQINRAQRTNMATIQEQLKDKMELQAFVLQCIQEYNDLAEQAKEQGCTVMELNRKKRRTEDDVVTREAYLEISATDIMQINLSNFRVWGSKLLRHVVFFIEPTLDLQSMKHLQKFALQCYLEFSLDVRVTGDRTDTVASLNKLECFTSLRNLYIKLGRRLKGKDLASDTVWCTEGHYSCATVGEGDEKSVTVRNKTLGRSATLPQELYEDDPHDFSDASIQKNWSQLEACILIGGEEYHLQNLFPILGRKLRRRNSDANAVSGRLEEAPQVGTDAESSMPDLDAMSVRSARSASSSAKASPKPKPEPKRTPAARPKAARPRSPT